jgi:uncharacterized SAM-dependent methyltransferase
LPTKLNLNKEITEKHIVEVFDKTTNRNICGFFRFGIDINFDGQLLLDAHAINTSKVLPNIRKFDLNIKKAFDFLLPIKKDFIENHLDGFCPVRSKGLNKWIENRKKQEVITKIKQDIFDNKPLIKFSYLDRGADDFLKVLSSKEYHTVQNELKTIKNNRQNIQSFIKPNIVVLGTGNGLKIKEMLKGSKRNITLIDISHKLIKVSRSNLKEHKLSEIIGGFESINLNKFKNTTFIMLGGTLFNNSNWINFINNINFNENSSNMILGVELLNGISINKIIKQYDNETGFKFIFNSLKLIGISRKDGKIQVVFNKIKHRIEEWFIFNKLKNKILLSISIKLKKDKFLEILNKDVLLNLKEGNNHLFVFK